MFSIISGHFQSLSVGTALKKEIIDTSLLFINTVSDKTSLSLQHGTDCVCCRINAAWRVMLYSFRLTAVKHTARENNDNNRERVIVNVQVLLNYQLLMIFVNNIINLSSNNVRRYVIRCHWFSVFIISHVYVLSYYVIDTENIGSNILDNDVLSANNFNMFIMISIMLLL